MKTFIIKQFKVVDPSRRGHWYQLKAFKAKDKADAIRQWFPDGVIPKDYRVVSAGY